MKVIFPNFRTSAGFPGAGFAVFIINFVE